MITMRVLNRPGRPMLIGIAVSLVFAGTAAAYWAGGGAGAATGTATTTQAVVVSAGTPTTRVYPGGQAAVAVNIANPNAFPVRVAALALDPAQGTGGFAVDAGHASCGVGSLSFTGQNNGGSGWNVPPRVGAVNGSLAVELANSLSMAAGAADSCQGASFTVYLKVAP
jgi:hypothetical protein